MKTVKVFTTFLAALCALFLISCDKGSASSASNSSSSSNTADEASTAPTVDDRPRLYSTISTEYFLDDIRCSPLRTNQFIAFYGGMRKIADSKDPLVSKLAKTADENHKSHNAMYDKAFAIRSGGDLDVVGMMIDDAHKRQMDAFSKFINSGIMVRNLLANAMNIETDAQTQDDLMNAYEAILADAKKNPRGTPVGAKSFTADFIDRRPGYVHVTLRNGSGRTLHNATVIAVARHDLSKINATQDADNVFVGVFGNPGPEFEAAQAAVEAAYAHSANTDRGFEVFIPEWKNGQTIETAFVSEFEVGQLKPGEISVFSDETSAMTIPLDPEKMAAAVKSPSMSNPKELTPPQQEQEEVAEQAKSLQITRGDGVITYRYLIYPIWSQGETKVIAPPDMKYVNIVWEPNVDVEMSVNSYIINAEPFAEDVIDGHIINDAAKIGCGPGSVLAFKTTSSNDPVEVAIRFLSREPNADEKGNVELKAPTAGK